MQAELDPHEQIVTAGNVDLSNCDKELIHIPGLIQPHGVMLVLRSTDLAILQASENTATMFSVGAADLAQQGLATLLGPEQAEAVRDAIARAGERLERGPYLLLQLLASPGRDRFDAIAHRAGGLLILELERVKSTQHEIADPCLELVDCAHHLRGANGLQQFLQIAATQIRAFSGFDRVMAYQFAEDGSGEVVAEARGDHLTPYLGMHFPASDIPAPARRLFALSWLRHLPDVNYAPVRMLPEAMPAVDMSRAALRHVSVMYSSYLKNMGVQASMVMPLMKSGRLWGLISCMHHASPLHVSCGTRTATEMLSHMVSLLMAEQEEHDTAGYQLRMNRAIAGLSRQMANELNYKHGLCRGEFSLHGWLDAAGAALVTDDGIELLGETPTRAEVSGIVAWFEQHDKSASVLAVDQLSRFYPPAEALRHTASGVLVVRLMRSSREFVIWFRPELVRSIAWAGDPNKPVQVDVVDGEARLTPRTSFELWKQTVQGCSAPWLECEIAAACALRQAIGEAALIRLNEDLRRSNTELDNFSYIAAHDLKEPLRGIHNFAHFLNTSANAKLTEEERGRLQTIIRLTRRMDDLTDALLQYARIGQTEVELETVDLNQLLEHSLDLLASRLAETGTTVRVTHPLPILRTNRGQITAVLMNLVVNATKYNDLPAGQRWVEIGWRHEPGRVVIHVRDNGIGIADRHLEQVFLIFRRLHGRDEYGGGNGAGLTIARRTVERLGGRLWAESPGLGLGATFLFSLPEGSVATVTDGAPVVTEGAP